MLKGFDKDGNIKDVMVTEDGAIKVAMEQGGGGEAQEVQITNTSTNPVPVNITNAEEVETTLNASVQTVGTTASSVSINKKVTSIDVANYSETSDVTVSVGNLSAVIGSNIATTLVINDNVTNIGLVSTEADTKVQIVVKGVN